VACRTEKQTPAQSASLIGVNARGQMRIFPDLCGLPRGARVAYPHRSTVRSALTVPEDGKLIVYTVGKPGARPSAG
jgi:hypothetical protein